MKFDDYGVLGYFLENLTEEQRKADWDQTYAEMTVSKLALLVQRSVPTTNQQKEI